MAALFISRQTLRREMNTRRVICERMALVQQSSLLPCIVRGGAGNTRGQTSLNEHGRAAQTKRPVRGLQTHPYASSSVSELHGETQRQTDRLVNKKTHIRTPSLFQLKQLYLNISQPLDDFCYISLIYIYICSCSKKKGLKG